MQSTHDRLIEMLTSLKLPAIRDQLDTLLGELARQDLALPEVLAMLCERESAICHSSRTRRTCSSSSSAGATSGAA
jgi:hypothetical protein